MFMLYLFSPDYIGERVLVVYTLTLVYFIVLFVKKYKIVLTWIKSRWNSGNRKSRKIDLYINSHKKICYAIIAVLLLWFLGICLYDLFEVAFILEIATITTVCVGFYFIVKCLLFIFNNLTEVLDNTYIRRSLEAIYFIELYFIVFGSYILNALPSYDKDAVVLRGLDTRLEDFHLFFFYSAYVCTTISIVGLLVTMAVIVFKYKIVKKSIMNKLKFILFVYLQFTVLFTALVILTNFLFGDFHGLMRSLTMANILNVAYNVVISSMDITVFSSIVKTVFGKIDVVLMVISNLTFMGIFIGMLLENEG